MPVILKKSDEIKWANSKYTFNEVEPLLKPYSSQKISIEEEIQSVSNLDLFLKNLLSNLNTQFWQKFKGIIADGPSLFHSLYTQFSHVALSLVGAKILFFPAKHYTLPKNLDEEPQHHHIFV